MIVVRNDGSFGFSEIKKGLKREVNAPSSRNGRRMSSFAFPIATSPWQTDVPFLQPIG